MVDANQQWDRPTALRIGRSLEQFGLVWIEEPLDAYDAEGHAQLAAALDTPIATGEMLSSVGEHVRLIDARAADIIQPDAPRIGGITPFLKLATLADHAGLQLAPHFAMEIHLHLAAAYPREPWVEHFEWLNPLFNERLETWTAGCWSRTGRGSASPRASSAPPGRSTPASSCTPMKRGLAYDVVAELKRRILAGELAPGAKLPARTAWSGVRRQPDGHSRGGLTTPGGRVGGDVPGARVVRAGGSRSG